MYMIITFILQCINGQLVATSRHKRIPSRCLLPALISRSMTHNLSCEVGAAMVDTQNSAPNRAGPKLFDCDRDDLIDKDALEKLIEQLTLDRGDPPTRKTALKTRWLGMVMWWHRRSTEARKKYFLLRGLQIFGSVTLPSLAALQVTVKSSSDPSLSTATS